MMRIMNYYCTLYALLPIVLSEDGAQRKHVRNATVRVRVPYLRCGPLPPA